MSGQVDDAAHEWRLLLVGDYDVGKTTIIDRLVNRDNVRHIATMGAEIRVPYITVDGETHKLIVWDVYGGEKWNPHCVRFTCYLLTVAVVLVYDITNRKSFDSLVEGWMMAFRINTANAKYKITPIIVGNKADLHDQRTVFREEAEAYARSIGAFYYETCASTGNSVNHMIKGIVRTLVSEGIPDDKMLRDMQAKGQAWKS